MDLNVFFGSALQTFFEEFGVQILLNHKDYDHKSVSLWPMLDANMRTLYLCATHTNYHTIINNLDAGFLDASLQTLIKRFN